MAILVRTCCCGCDLRTGILLIAIFGVLSGSFGIYSRLSSAKKLKDLNEEIREFDEEGKLPIPYKFYNVVIDLDYASAALNGMVILTNIFLLISYSTRNRFLALPYIFLHILLLAYNLGVTIFFIAIWHGFPYIFVGTIIAWLLSIYFIMVVFSYHEALREDPSGSSAGYGPPTPMVQVAGGLPPYAKF